ncbi:MAG: hypothetical protein ACOYOU_00995 [Kiritimatiellia bacterium]
MSYVITSQHQLYFDVKGRVHIPDLAASLLAFDRMMGMTKPAIRELLFQRVGVQGFDIYVERIQAGSFIEDFLFRFSFKNQRSYNRAVQRLREVTGVEALQNKYPIFGFIIVGALAYGTVNMLSHIPGCNENKDIQRALISLNNVNNNGVMIINGEPIQDLLDRTVRDKKSFSVYTNKVLLPAKLAGGGSVKVDGQENLAITPDVISTIPTIQAYKEQSDQWEDFGKIRVVVRALNLDSEEKGWRCFVPSISEKRVPMHPFMGIQPAELLPEQGIEADISLRWHLTKDGSKEPAEVHIRKIYPAP